MIIYSEARKLSIKKWQWVVDNWDYSLSNDANINRLLRAIPELKTLTHSCGWCDYYLCGLYTCTSCVLDKISNGKACSIWYKNFRNKEKTPKIRRKNAIKILNACKAIPEVEDDK